MDYDDNDSQSQNIHLGSEGSSKYPPASQPYALPRFDFDDSLQGHLRFDSLVDSEVFLGIGSNEDNQWIEDFSRGNSSVAFNSTGADTSSISIHKNVWSEATSSESVEMLLKSIGQEEVNPTQITLNESVSCYELGSVTGQMETSSQIGSGSHSKAGDVTESHAMLTSHDIPDSSPRLEEDVRVEDIQVHYSSQTCETSLDGHSSAPDVDVVYDKEGGSPVAEGNLSNAEQFAGKDKAKTDTLNDKLVNEFAGDLSTSDVEVINKERGSPVAEVSLSTVEQITEKDVSETGTLKDKLMDSYTGDLSASDVQVTEKEGGFPVAAGSLSIVEQITEKDEAETGTLKDKLVDNYAGDLSASNVQVTDMERRSPVAGDLFTAEQITEKDESEMGTVKDKLVENYAGDLSASDVQVTDKDRGTPVAEGSLSTVEQITEKDEVETGTLNDNLVDNFAGDLTAADVQVTDKEIGSAVEECNLPISEQFTAKDEAKTDTVNDKLLDNYPEDLSASDVQVSNNIKCNIEFGSQDVSHQSDDKSEEYAEVTEGRCFEAVAQPHDPSNKDLLMDDQILNENRVANVVSLEVPCSDSIMEPLSEVKETLMSTVEPSCGTAEDDPLLKIPDECRKFAFHSTSSTTTNSGTVARSVDVQMSANPDVHMDQVSSIPDAQTNLDRCLEEDSNENASRCAIPALTMDTPEQMRCCVQDDHLLNSSNRSGTESSFNETEKCFLAAEKNLDTNSGEVESSKFQGDGISDLVVVSSSAESLKDPPAAWVMTDVSVVSSEIKEPTIPIVSPILSEFNKKRDQGTLGGQVSDVECGNSVPTIVEENRELPTDDSKNDGKNSGTEGDVEKEKLEMKSQYKGCNEPVQVTHVSDVISTAQVSFGASLSSPLASSPVVCRRDIVSLPERVISGNLSGEGSPEIDNQPTLEVDTESKKIHHNVMAIETNQGSDDKMEVSPSMSSLQVKEGNTAELPASPGRLEDAASQVNDEKVSQIAGDVSKDLEGSSGLASLSGLDAELKAPDDGSSHAENTKATCDSPTVFKSIDLPQSGDRTEECRIGHDSAEVAKKNEEDPSGNNVSKNGEGFTFELSSIANVSGNEAGKSLQAASTISASMTPQMVGKTPSSPSLCQSDAKTSHDTQTQQPVEVVRAGSKSTSERKSRRTPVKALSKDNTKQRKTLKEATPVRQSEKGKKSVNTSFSPPAICSPLQSLFGNVECSGGKTFGILGTPTSSDLNTSASAPASALYHQPFTDLQQVQLRAQIFVYGALIQGMVPEEGYMTSAFGGPDGGRNMWENAWRTSMERLQSQNLLAINPETPLQSRCGSGVSDVSNNQSVARNKVNSASVGQAGSRVTPSSAMSPMFPLSSPLWAYQTPSSDAMHSSGLPRGPVFDYKQSLSPLHSYQTPPVRNVVGHNTSWMAQASFRGPWVASPQTSGPDSSTRFPQYPPTEVVQLTPVRELSLPRSSGTKNASAAPGIQGESPGNMLLTTSPTVNLNKMVGSAVQKSGSKSRKRQKAPISEIPDQTSEQPHSSAESIPLPSGSSHPFVSLGTLTPPGIGLKVSTESAMMQTTSMEHMKNLLDNGEQRSILSEESLSKIKEARVQAENAASTAAAATNHCQVLWSELAKHSSRLVPDVEERLSSAAAAIAAAACVAKAAASVANVAANAALQAKLMAEEAMVSSGYINVLSDDVTNANATPSSMLKGGNGAPTSNSVIVVAKEAARRRVEATTAASKQAENLDAIVKAAELAAEAVSHAGKIVAMGNPLALSELVKSGPEGYWKAHMSPELACNSSEGGKEHLGIGSAGASVGIDAKASARLKSAGSREMIGHCKDDDMSGSAAANKNDGGLKGCKVSDVARTIEAVTESETATKTSISVHNDHDIEVQTLTQSSIEKGCLVEVLRGSAAWYQANVVDVQDGKAFVCYAELKLDEGSGNLKEWVSLGGDSEAPRIRIARPMGATQFEGRRKRRRAAIGDYNWSIGDHVDAWVQDRWCEGIVTERSKKDSTTFIVQFPSLEQTSDIKAWHLRPSLIWKDGNWIEMSQSRGKHSSTRESDSPLEKRRKMGTPAMEKGKDKIPKNNDSVESGKPEDVRLLDLAANEKTFNMGKSNRDEKKHDSLRSLRTNLQKGGTGVIFGVPKPGKKRKFMEVSKHYVSDQGGKNSEASKSMKIAKMMPQSSGSRGTKDTAKGGIKEKGGPVTKPKIPKPVKSHGTSTRNIVQKDKDSDSSVSASAEETVGERSDSVKKSTSHVHNTSGKRGLEHGSVSRDGGSTMEGSFVFSSTAASSDIPSRRTYSSNKTGRANKGKLAPAGSKLAKVEERVSDRNEANSSSEVMEPRRSVRRIQPTSRLLEGLQSSFISKIPSVSHDRSHKGQNKSAPRGSTRR